MATNVIMSFEEDLVDEILEHVPFAEGLIDEILSELPLAVRDHIIFNWAAIFATPDYHPDPMIVKIIGTITTLNFRRSRAITHQSFSNLTHLPFSSSLAHLDLYCIPPLQSGNLMGTLSHPVFQHLKILYLTESCLRWRTVESLSSTPPLFQLEKFFFSSHVPIDGDLMTRLFNPNNTIFKNLTHLSLSLDFMKDYSPLAVLGQSPFLSNLISLQLYSTGATLNTSQAEITQQAIPRFINSPFLWNPQLKHLTLARMHSSIQFDHLISVLNSANIQLETLEIPWTTSSLSVLANASCLSTRLKNLTLGDLSDGKQQDVVENFLLSPIFSHLEVLTSNVLQALSLTPTQLISLLKSPNMSNDLIEVKLSGNLANAIETLCTQRVIPNDKTSQLKFGKLRKVDIAYSNFVDNDIKLIVENLPMVSQLITKA